MIIEKKFQSVAELQALQSLACQVNEDVFIHSLDDTVKVDAKSFIGLFTLDFSGPVRIVTESQYVAQKLKG